MGVCHSGCRTPPPELEYYDAWRHSVPRSRKRLKERVKTSKQALRSPRCCVLGPSAVDVAPAPAKVWVCAHGCCSIRWKLDYGGFLSYKAYADISPYVVTVDEARSCRCVICEGLPSAQMNRRGGSAWSRVDHLSRKDEYVSSAHVSVLSKASGKASFSSGESLTDDEELML